MTYRGSVERWYYVLLEKKEEEALEVELPTLVLHEALFASAVEQGPLADGEEAKSMADLPDEILTIIFRSLSSVKELVSVMHTCRRFCRLCLRDEIWRLYAPHCAFKSSFTNANKRRSRRFGYKNLEHGPLAEGEEEKSMGDLSDDMLTLIFKSMSSVKELVSVMQTCRRFYRLCLPDEIWRLYAPGCALKSSFINAIKGCPRMLSYKNLVLSDRLSMTSFRDNPWVYESMRDVMNGWWMSCSVNWSEEEGGYFNGPRSTAQFDYHLNKVDLGLVYETLDVIFTDMTDCIASALLMEFGVRSDTRSVQGANGGTTDPAMTTKLWEAVLTQWWRYDQWLKLAVANSENLNKLIMAQRQSSHAWGASPTLYEKGSTYFRNQVVLRFGLRFPLQEGQKWLLQQEATGSASPRETWLLDCISMLLKELDVPDDLSLSKAMSAYAYTRVKLMRCFVLELDALSFTPDLISERKQLPSHFAE